MNFTIIPAIDLRGGQVVRLRQGDYSQQTSYRTDPAILARQYAATGAGWLHLVDLDGARDGTLSNLQMISLIAQCGISIQAGGGVRSEDDVDRLLDAGASRVVVGSVAVREPGRVCGWLQRFGADRLCLALDTRLDAGVWTLPSAGWTRAETATLDELAPRYAAAGAVHLLCTDIARDGMMAGPNIALYRHLHRLVPQMCVQASGGLRDLDDVRAVRDTGAAAVVVGRSLLEGQLDLAQALAC